MIPPMMYSDPFYRITHLIKEEIRKYKWIEGEKAGGCPGRRRELSGRSFIDRTMKNFSLTPCRFLRQLFPKSRSRSSASRRVICYRTCRTDPVDRLLTKKAERPWWRVHSRRG